MDTRGSLGRRALALAALSLAVTGPACDLIPRPNADEIAVVESAPVSYPYRFVVLGDSRTPGVGVFRELLDQIGQLTAPEPLFTLNAGDVVLVGAANEYNNYTAELEGFPFPFITGIGNHEQYVAGGQEAYIEVFGDEDFYFDHGLARFIYLDNSNPGSYGLTQAQLDWMENLLDDPGHPDRFVFMHVPPTLPSGGAVSTSEARGDVPGDDVYSTIQGGVLDGIGAYATWPELINLLEAYQVRVAFYGHIHAYEHSFANGVHHVITGGGGAEIGLQEDNPPDEGIFHHFLDVRIAADGNSHVDVIKRGAGTAPSVEYGFDVATTPVAP